jgi:hypothetical protein
MNLLLFRYFSCVNLSNMSEKSKKRLLYGVLATLPFAAVFLAGQILGSLWFVLFFLFYIFIYRPALDTQRLMSLNVIEEKEAWRFFVPFAVDHTRYIKVLWLG